MRLAIAGCVVSFALASEALAWTVNVDASGQYIDSQVNSYVYQDARASQFPGDPPDLSAHVAEPACVPVPVCFTTWNLRADASANLTTGQLGVYAGAFLGSHDEFVAATGFATFSDSLIFHLPANMSSASITLSMDVHATSSIPRAMWLYDLSGYTYVSLGGAVDSIVWQDVNFGSGAFSRVLSATAIVQDGVPVDFEAALSAAVAVSPFAPGFQPGYYDFDASHTATLSITAPAGVTWDSDSSVFLTQVPEPSAALQLVLVGVPGVFAASRLRRPRSGRP